MQYLIMLDVPVQTTDSLRGTVGTLVHPIIVTADSETDANVAADKIARAIDGSVIIRITLLDGVLPDSVAAPPSTASRRTEIAVLAMVVAGVVSSLFLKDREPIVRAALSGAIAALTFGVSVWLKSLPPNRTA
jgi:hypothetical protein